jgi:hypothetical protein
MSFTRVTPFVVALVCMTPIAALCNRMARSQTPPVQTGQIALPASSGPADLMGKSHPSPVTPAPAIANVSGQGQAFIPIMGRPGQHKNKPIATPEGGGAGETLLVVLLGMLFLVSAARRKMIQRVI